MEKWTGNWNGSEKKSSDRRKEIMDRKCPNDADTWKKSVEHVKKSDVTKRTKRNKLERGDVNPQIIII